MSANAFWKNGRFRGHEVLWDIEVPFALDCGGFTAMKAYGGYRWAIWDYVAQMEHCLFGDAAYIEGMGHDGSRSGRSRLRVPQTPFRRGRADARA